MTVKEQTETVENKVVDDLGLDTDKLAALKAKMAAKESKKEELPIKIVAKKSRSIRLGFIGSGQAGGKLASTAHQLGYDAVAFNTAPQDLGPLQIPEANKFLFEYGLGGAAKELGIGREAAEAHRDLINQVVTEKLEDAQVLVFCLSLGGGSGAGSCETIVDVLSTLGKPVVVITVLPMDTDDAQTKKNALETLSKLAREVQNKRIHNLVVVDNAKIETIYSDVSQMDFFEVSNKAIVEPLEAFNSLSSMPSSVKGLDPMEFSKLLLDGNGISVYGAMTVTNYQEDTAIAEAALENLNNGLLAGGFDLKQSKYVGVIIAANKSVWSKIPSASVNYAMAVIGEQCGNPGIFKGIYTIDSQEDSVKVYSFFSGLGLPEPRVEQLKKETAVFTQKNKDKEVERNLSLKLDTGTEENVSAAEKIRQEISRKKSAFGSLLSSSVSDRRKK